MSQPFTFKAIDAARLRTEQELAELRAISGRAGTLQKILAFGTATVLGQQLSAKVTPPVVVPNASGGLTSIVDPLRSARQRIALPLIATETGLGLGQTVLFALIHQKERELAQLNAQEQLLLTAASAENSEQSATGIDVPPVWTKDP